MSRYIILDKGWYRPGFMREDGTLAGLNGHGFGFVGAYSISQIGDVQKRLVALSWQVSAADPKVWDAIWASLQGKTIPGSGAPFTGWGWTKDEIVRRGSKLLVTPSYTPPDDLVAAALAFASDVDAMIAYYKKIAPESSGAVESAKAEINQKLARIGPLQDPSAVAWKTLGDELRGGIGNLATIGLVLGLAVMAGASVFGKLKGG